MDEGKCGLAHLSLLMSTWWTMGGGRGSCLSRLFRAERMDRRGKWQRWPDSHRERALAYAHQKRSYMRNSITVAILSNINLPSTTFWKYVRDYHIHLVSQASPTLHVTAIAQSQRDCTTAVTNRGWLARLTFTPLLFRSTYTTTCTPLTVSS